MDAYEVALKQTRKFLVRKARTAAEVADSLGISRVAAYERLRALAARGDVFETLEVQSPRGKKGPKAKLWAIV